MAACPVNRASRTGRCVRRGSPSAGRPRPTSRPRGSSAGCPRSASGSRSTPPTRRSTPPATSSESRLSKTLIVEHDGEVIGDLMLAVDDAWAQVEVAEQARSTQAELGWVIAPEHAGKGYATEAAGELLRFCFEDLGVRRVIAQCFADNVASWKLMERLGMRLEVRAREGVTAPLGHVERQPLLRDPRRGVARASAGKEGRLNAPGPERGPLAGAAPTGSPSAPRPRRTPTPCSTSAVAPRSASGCRSLPTDRAAWAERFADPDRLAMTLAFELDGEIIGDLFLRVTDAWAQAEVEDQAKKTQAEIGWVLAPEHAGHGLRHRGRSRAAADLLRGPRPAPGGRPVLRRQRRVTADHGEARHAPARSTPYATRCTVLAGGWTASATRSSPTSGAPARADRTAADAPGPECDRLAGADRTSDHPPLRARRPRGDLAARGAVRASASGSPRRTTTARSTSSGSATRTGWR